jgi:hypothetical protein
MIKANELRVGSWVYETIVDLENGGSKQVPTQVDGNRIKCVEMGDTLRGIPISNEILLSCGFVFNDHSSSYRIFSHKEEWILAAQQTMDKSFFKIGLPVDRRLDHYMTSLIFLHQLQNLFFALTGTELNYNPNGK